MQDNNYLRKLTEKYCEGLCSPEELTAIDALLRESNAAKAEFREACQDWQNNHKMDSIEEHALASLISRIEEPRHIRGNVKAKLAWAYSIAAAAAVVCIISLFAVLPEKRDDVTFYSVCSTKDNSTIVNLPDASRINLMNGAKVVYSSEFSSSNREVEFEGEAYFEVATDPQHPFVVKMKDNAIKVYGTKFNVVSKGDDLMVTLVKGSVELETPSRNVKIAPGEMVSYKTSTGDIDVRYVNPESYMALMEGNLEYYNVTLAELSGYLGNIYGKEIILSPRLSSNSTMYNLRLVNHEKFEDVLSALKVMVPMSIRTEGNRVWLTEK